MTTFLTGDDLASYLEEPLDGAIQNIADRVNALVTEKWANPATPVPEWVKNIAWNVAIRAGANRKGVTSQTRSWDDVTKTDRWEAGTFGVELTDDETLKLSGLPDGTGASVGVKSIRMTVPGWDRPPGYTGWIPPCP